MKNENRKLEFEVQSSHVMERHGNSLARRPRNSKSAKGYPTFVVFYTMKSYFGA